MKECELIQLYQEALKEGNRNKKHFILTAIFEQWEGRIKNITFKIWSTCKLQEYEECVGERGTQGNFYHCAFLGLGKAAEKYDNHRSFYSYCWKTIRGVCMNYCLRECFKGREMVARLPEKLKSESISVYLKKWEKDDKALLKENYTLQKGDLYKPKYKSLSIGKVLRLIKCFDFTDSSLDMNREYSAPGEPVHRDLVVHSIERIMTVIKNNLSYLHILILTFLVMKIKQKKIANFLNIPEVTITREKQHINRELGIGVRMLFVPEILQSFSARDFEEKMINQKKGEHFILQSKEKKFLSSLYRKENDRYILSPSGQEEDFIEILTILHKINYFPPFLLDHLTAMDYFCQRFYDEMKELIEELKIKI